MKIRIYALLFAFVFLGACAEDKEIGKIQVPGMDYTLPQGGDAAADERVMELLKTYDSYFVYDFSEKDFEWTQIGGSLGDDVYRFDPIEPSKVSTLLDLLQTTWLDFYDKDFLKKAMPIRVFLAGNVQLRVEEWSWITWEYEYTWKDIPARYLDNQIAVGYMGKTVAEMSGWAKREYKSYLQATFLEYCLSFGLITIPEEFYALSDYTGNLFWESSEVAREAGFVYNPADDIEWSTEYDLSRFEDATAYLASLVYRTTEEWAADLEYPLIRKKYDILVNWLKKQYEIDVCKIGNTVYE